MRKTLFSLGCGAGVDPPVQRRSDRSGRGLHWTHQDAGAAHGRLGPQQVLPHEVEQRGGGDLEAVGVGAVREGGEGVGWLQGQDLRQRDLLAGPEEENRGLQVQPLLTGCAVTSQCPGWTSEPAAGSSHLVVFTSCVVLEQRDAFTVQAPVMSLPLETQWGGDLVSVLKINRQTDSWTDRQTGAGLLPGCPCWCSEPSILPSSHCCSSSWCV